jgi:hypothetical protein
MRKPNLNRKAKNLAEVNKAIQAKFPKVELVRGRGYYYIASEDDEMGLKIAGLYTTSIPVAFLHQQTIQGWVNSVEYLFKDEEGKYAGQESEND